MQFGKQRLVWLAAAVLVCSPSDRAHGEELAGIIPGLYGGDGIDLVPIGTHEHHFTDDSLQEFNSLSTAIGQNTGNFNYSSSVNSFSYDPVQAVFLPSIDSLGSLVGERAETIGRGKLNGAFSFSQLNYRRFEGQHLHSLSVVLPHGPCPPPECTASQVDDFITVSMDVKFTQDLMALYGTYGVTDKFDVSVVVPYLYNHMSVTAKARLNAGHDDAHQFDPTGATSDLSTSSGRGTKTGFGDVIVRGKYNFIRDKGWVPDSSFVVRGQFASGEQDEFMGTGHNEFRATFIFSKPIGLLTPHGNFGYEASTGGNQFDQFIWDGGIDARVTERAMLGFDIFGQFQNGDGVEANLINLAGGGRFNVMDNLVLFGITQFPLVKSNGLRTNMTWTVGLEYTFL